MATSIDIGKSRIRPDFTDKELFAMIYTLSGRIGKVVASYAVVARSFPAEVALI